MHLDKTLPGYLEELAELDTVLNAEAGPDVQALAAGEVDASLIAFIPQVAPLIEQGAPIDWAIPEEANGTAQGVGTLENGANHNAGQLFVEFLMSEAGQATLNGTGQAIAPIEGIEGSLAVENFAVIDTAQANDPAVADPFRERFESLFG
jgi:iron(III) transport system substrate-binding protein